VIIQNIPKIVFSHTLNNVDPIAIGWKNVKLAKGDFKDEVSELRQQPGKDILIGRQKPSALV
jgi:hypothetical protein